MTVASKLSTVAFFAPTDSGGFVRSHPDEPIPDLQLQFAAVRMRPHGQGLFTPPCARASCCTSATCGPRAVTASPCAVRIRDHVETVYHTAGTCPMGNDAMAVVDAGLKVHGVERLRVIDSSARQG